MAVACLSVVNPAFAVDREHQVKTGFIFSIAKFCEWDFSKRPGNRFIVGVYRTKAYDLDIDVLNGKTIFGRSVVVEEIKSEADIPNCQIVVLGDVGVEVIRHYASLCKNSGTMLIGESEGFAKYGGTVGFILEGGAVRFQVNLQTAQLDHVTFRSKLLILAEQVYK
ncbi:MAG: YfiR family protein [Fimbriimonas sp.]|nr:YfiR family protein [Fimbriimonas sp.]